MAIAFKWKNYRKGNKLEETSLEVTEFIRRFLLHVLPTGYFRIRYYGLFASRNREKRLLCQQILGCVPEKSDDSGSVKKTWQDWVLELTGVEPGICPYCKKGRLVSKLEPSIIPP